MKPFFLPLSLLLGLSLPGFGQLLTQNFNSWPAAWPQSPASSWSLSSLGTSGSYCILTENPGASTTTPITLSTPTLNVMGLTNFTVSFNAAVVKNNFLDPDIILSYDAGSGSQFAARWGSGFNSPTTYTLAQGGFDPSPPLDAAQVTWQACTHTLTIAAGNALRFIFTADMFNGGYVLIDDVVISGSSSAITALKHLQANPEMQVFPNPAPGKTVTVNGNAISQVSIYNQLGQQVFFEKNRNPQSSLELHLSQLPAGVYYLQAVLENNSLLSHKLVLE